MANSDRQDASRREVAPKHSQFLEFLGPPTLYEGETAGDFIKFYDRLQRSASPKDGIGEILLIDVAELSWEILRLRRQKASFMVHAMADGLFRILDYLFDDEETEADNTTDSDDTARSDDNGDGDVAADEEDDDNRYEVHYRFDDDEDEDEDLRTEREKRRDMLHSRWLAGDPDARQEVERLLQQAGYDWRVVEARALQARFDDFERFDRMIAQAEARRNGILREIDRHNDAVARRMRDAIADVEDAEFEDVIPGREAAE